MKKKGLFIVIGIFFVALIFGAFLVTGARAEQVKWPETLIVGTPSLTGANYTVWMGVAPVIKKYTPAKDVSIQPYGGPGVWGPMMAKKEVDLAMHSGCSVLDLFFGRGPYKKLGPIPVRTMIGGNHYAWGFNTYVARNIRSLSDLKGKVCYTRQMGNPMPGQVAEALLGAVGLSTKDLKAAMVIPSFKEGVKDLIEGKIDAFIYPFISVSVLQINQAKGEATLVPVTRKQAEAAIAKLPGWYICDVAAGEAGNKSEVKNAVCAQTGIHCRADLHPEIVYQLTKAILEHHDEWVGCHPIAKEWGLDQKPVTSAAEPYHEGAVKYYKEKGLWTPEIQKYNDDLFKQLKK